MKLPAYPRTKPSGVHSLGNVPEHWEVKRPKTSATCWVNNVDKVPAEDELPVRLCNYTDVCYRDHITSDMGLMETTATADEIRRLEVLALLKAAPRSLPEPVYDSIPTENPTPKPS